jgi:hypothetical protein
MLDIFLFWHFLVVLDALIVHKLFKDDAGDPKRVPSGCDPSLTVTKEGGFDRG